MSAMYSLDAKWNNKSRGIFYGPTSVYAKSRQKLWKCSRTSNQHWSERRCSTFIKEENLVETCGTNCHLMSTISQYQAFSRNRNLLIDFCKTLLKPHDRNAMSGSWFYSWEPEAVFIPLGINVLLWCLVCALTISRSDSPWKDGRCIAN